jgi:uncharacterized protein (DUF849 family)
MLQVALNGGRTPEEHPRIPRTPDELRTVSVRGLARGHGIRTGLEDTVYLPDGRLAQDNATLTRIAAAMIA